jgi:hypothetical protein
MLATAMAKADNVVLAAVSTQPVSQARTEITYNNFLLPIASLEQAASNIGHANVVPDGDGTVTDSYATGSVYSWIVVGVLVGKNEGTVSNSYYTDNVTGNANVGGLVGWNFKGTVTSSYSTGSVTGLDNIGGLNGKNSGTVSNSYASGSVTGNTHIGGLMGKNQGTVSNSFWDTQTSRQGSSDGGTGKNTTEMEDFTTFSVAGWDIITIANSSTRNTGYIWNIVDDVTYPFLSWQPI